MDAHRASMASQLSVINRELSQLSSTSSPTAGAGDKARLKRTLSELAARVAGLDIGISDFDMFEAKNSILERATGMLEELEGISTLPAGAGLNRVIPEQKHLPRVFSDPLFSKPRPEKAAERVASAPSLPPVEKSRLPPYRPAVAVTPDKERKAFISNTEKHNSERAEKVLGNLDAKLGSMKVSDEPKKEVPKRSNYEFKFPNYADKSSDLKPIDLQPLAMPLSPHPPNPSPTPSHPQTPTPTTSTPTPDSSDPLLTSLRVLATDVVIDQSRKLGSGGFGIVHAGTLWHDNPVAIKLIRPPISAETIATFKKELAIWAQLRHPNVLALMAYCEDPPMMISPLLPSGNLRTFLAKQSWPLPLALRLLLDVARGMSYLHSRPTPVLHGDLKSQNILISRSVAYITDFGMSRLRERVALSGSGIGWGGTPGFMAPELYSQALKPGSDVWAFGGVCYEVISQGKYPYFEAKGNQGEVGPQPPATRISGANRPIAQIMRLVRHERRLPSTPPTVSTAPPGSPERRLWSLMVRCWSYEPASRPTFREISEELQRIVDSLDHDS